MTSHLAKWTVLLPDHRTTGALGMQLCTLLIAGQEAGTIGVVHFIV